MRRFAMFSSIFAAAALPVVLLVCGCGGGGSAVVSAVTNGNSGPAPLTSIRFNDPSKAPSANLVFDGSKWTTKAGATVTHVGEGNVQQGRQGGGCSGCHEGIHNEYRTDKRVGNATGTEYSGADLTDTPNHANAHGENFQFKLARGGMCHSCHTTGYGEEGGYDEAKGASDPDNFAFEGIQCEACHGPGSAHVSSGGDKNLINRIPDARQTCWSCHVPGTKWNWGTQGMMAAKTDADLMNSRPAISVHHPQAALLAGVTGYEYPGKSYLFGARGHDQIGNSCITCHLTQAPSAATGKADHSRHSLEVDMSVCASCHPDPAAALQAFEHEIEHLLIVLAGEDPEHPGHPDASAKGGLLGQWAAANPALQADLDNGTNSSSNTSAAKKYKAARHNFSFIEHDKSFGIHNPKYAKQLLEDSIEDLENALSSL